MYLRWFRNKQHCVDSAEIRVKKAVKPQLFCLGMRSHVIVSFISDCGCYINQGKRSRTPKSGPFSTSHILVNLERMQQENRFSLWTKCLHLLDPVSRLYTSRSYSSPSGLVGRLLRPSTQEATLTSVLRMKLIVNLEEKILVLQE